MREILFRGKQEYKNKEWVFGNLHCEYGETDKNGQRKIDYRILGMRGECDYVLSETVGQFTGLTDKNGKRIFEGDIAKNEYEDRNYQYFKIFYNEKTLRWEVMNKYGMRGNLHNVIGNMEVIGNIHDNPELLENP